MATTVYGAWQGAASSGKVTHRAYLTYTVITNNDDTYTINVSASGVDPWNGTWNKVTTDYTWGATGYATGTGQKVITVSNSNPYALVGSRNYTYSKTHSSQSKTVFATTTLNHVSSSGGGSSVNGKKSTASVTFTIPARTSYSVTYNANNGTNAPAAQTKWYNENLTLQSGIPTRPHFIFTGWNTAADGSGTAYAPGATYTANIAVTLYAQWKPTIYVRPNGTWKNVTQVYVKVNNVWKIVNKAYKKENGTWK